MAWRPTHCLIEGELDNTTPDKVTGWMQFAGMDEKVSFNLQGNFHRDIRGAKIRFTGDGCNTDPSAKRYMDSFASHQTGKVGDITAGLPPADYTKYPYLEWFSEENGRVVIELSPDQVRVIGRPIPACESDPISRQDQARNMAQFLVEISQAAAVVAVAPQVGVVSDPKFTHWVMEQGQICGEAYSVQTVTNKLSFAYVRLFNMPECAEFGYIETCKLSAKNNIA